MTKAEIKRLKSNLRKTAGLGYDKGTPDDVFVNSIFDQLYNLKSNPPYPCSFSYNKYRVEFEWDATDSHLVLTFERNGEVHFGKSVIIEELITDDFNINDHPTSFFDDYKDIDIVEEE